MCYWNTPNAAAESKNQEVYGHSQVCANAQTCTFTNTHKHTRAHHTHAHTHTHFPSLKLEDTVKVLACCPSETTYYRKGDYK